MRLNNRNHIAPRLTSYAAALTFGFVTSLSAASPAQADNQVPSAPISVNTLCTTVAEANVATANNSHDAAVTLARVINHVRAQAVESARRAGAPALPVSALRPAAPVLPAMPMPIADLVAVPMVEPGHLAVDASRDAAITLAGCVNRTRTTMLAMRVRGPIARVASDAPSGPTNHLSNPPATGLTPYASAPRPFLPTVTATQDALADTTNPHATAVTLASTVNHVRAAALLASTGAAHPGRGVIDAAPARAADLSHQAAMRLAGRVNRARAQVARAARGHRNQQAYSPVQVASNVAHRDVIVDAYRLRGTRYVFGGTSRSGFDCSGFVRYILGHAAGVDLPRTATEQYYHGHTVSRDALQPGDLVFFRNTYKRGISHVGIYVGAGKFVHAANASTGVREDSLDSGYYANHYAGARRVLASEMRAFQGGR